MMSMRRMRRKVLMMRTEEEGDNDKDDEEKADDLSASLTRQGDVVEERLLEREATRLRQRSEIYENR